MPLVTRRLWLRALQVGLLAFLGALIVLQVPELRYDLSGARPVPVEEPRELTPERFPGSTFAAVRGTPDFDRAFVYRRYGLSFSYFTAQPYGPRLVVRTLERVDDEWRDIRRLVGRLRPFDEQPFSYRIRDIYRDEMGVDVPGDAFFLALDDVPEPSGWQIGLVAFACLLWVGMFWGFFLRGRRTAR